MERSSGTPSSRQVVAMPGPQFAFSSSSAGNGGGTPPSPPSLNLPDSYWARPHVHGSAERLSKTLVFSENFVQRVTAVRLKQGDFMRALAEKQEGLEQNLRSILQGSEFQINITPFQVPDISLSAETSVHLAVLKVPDGEEPQPHSSTSQTAASAATATQQDTVASGCCIPPSCAIL